jgi:hypothetical protein
MKALKSARTLAASLGVLAAGALAATPAMAFDNVDWTWNKYVDEYVDIDAYIDIDIESTGMVEVEKLQIFLGSVKTTANVVGVINIQPDAGGYYRDTYYSYKCYTCWGKEWIAGSFDAVKELPEVINAATSIGNLQSITSDVPVFLHDAQFVANTNDKKQDYYRYDKFANLLDQAGNGSGYGHYYESGNLHTDLAKAFIYGAVYGLLSPAEISAKANVALVVNASVANSATAVANITTVTLESNVDGSKLNNGAANRDCHTYCDVDRLSNHVVIADLTQFAYANVSADANVLGVVVNNYNSLGLIDRALVDNAATAIGNAVQINVGNIPVPDAP